jgi:anti-sigma factor RsiW
MCDVQAKLIARLDQELPKDEAIALDRHIEGCEECRRWAAACGQASDIFDAYYDAVMAAKATRQVPRWVPVLAGAVIATGVLFLALPRMRVERPLVGPTATPLPNPNKQKTFPMLSQQFKPESAIDSD